MKSSAVCQRDVHELEFGARRYRLVQDRVDVARLRPKVVAGAAPCRDKGAGIRRWNLERVDQDYWLSHGLLRFPLVTTHQRAP
jgi:hypothetical protein